MMYSRVAVAIPFPPLAVLLSAFVVQSKSLEHAIKPPDIDPQNPCCTALYAACPTHGLS